MDSICDFDFIAFDNPWICIDFIVSIFPKKCKAMGCQNENSHISFVDCTKEYRNNNKLSHPINKIGKHSTCDQ